jgi:hypothetical protein
MIPVVQEIDRRGWQTKPVCEYAYGLELQGFEPFERRCRMSFFDPETFRIGKPELSERKENES